MVERMARAVRWRERQLDYVLIAAERAANALWRKKLPLEEFLMSGGEQNPYAVVLLIERLKRSGQIDEDVAGRQKSWLAKVCGEDLRRLEQDVEGELGRRTSLEEQAVAVPGFIQEETANLCAAALILEERTLLYAVLRLYEKLGSMDEAAALSRRIFSLLRHTPSELACQIRLYRAFYDCLSMEWNQRIAYTQGVEILVPETLPEGLRELVWQAVEDGHLRYADLVLKLFLPVHLSQLGMDADTFMERIFRTDNDTLFRGILFAEKMILQDAPSFVEGVEQWREVLMARCRAKNMAWQSVREWFDMYYLCRRVTAYPEGAGEFLEDWMPMEPYKASYQKTNSVQQEAFEALFMTKDRSILRLLEILGENNVFRFQSEEEYFPYYENNPSYSLTAAVQNLIAQGLSAKEMIYIYMNTHLRSCYRMNAFLRLVFASGDGLEIRGAEASVQEYFAPYRLVGRVRKWEGYFGLLTQNIWMDSKLILFPLSWQMEHKELCQKMKEEGTIHSFHVTRMNMNSYSLRGILDGEGKAGPRDNEEIVRILCEELETVIETAELTTKQNSRISQLAAERRLTKEQKQRLGIQMMKCCAALGEKPSQLRYFVNMFNRLGNGQMNPWRHQVFRKENEWRQQPAEMAAEAEACWKKLTDHAPAPEELFFVYINMPFKYCIPFSALVESCYPQEGIIDLEPMISGHSQYFFSGRILSVQPDRRPGHSGWFVNLAPDEFYRGRRGRWDIFQFWTKEADGYAEGLSCQFEIHAYQASRRIFFIKNIIHRQDVRSFAARQIFLGAMNRAAYSERLSSRDLGDLNVQVKNWSARDIGKLVQPMMNALKKRADNITAMSGYLAAIEKSNPWRFGEEPIPDRHSWPKTVVKDNTCEFCRRLFVQIVSQNELRSILRIYFNTVIKSYVGLDTVFFLCKEGGRELSSLGLWMKEYPLLVRADEGQLRPVNFGMDGELAGHWPKTELTEEGKEYRCFVAGYEEGMKAFFLLPEE